jgi:hypothetical protein
MMNYTDELVTTVRRAHALEVEIARLQCALAAVRADLHRPESDRRGGCPRGRRRPAGSYGPAEVESMSPWRGN